MDIRVHVVPALAPGASLLERRWQDHAAERRAQLDEMERILGGPDGVVKVPGPIVGEPAMTLFAKSAGQSEQSRADLLNTFARMRTDPPPKPSRRWTLASGYETIERAQVVVNIRGEQERPHADRLIVEVARIRKDPEVFDQILSWRGRKTPITAVAAEKEPEGSVRVVRALDILTGDVRAIWTSSPPKRYRWQDIGKLMVRGQRLYFVTDDEFSAIPLDDIKDGCWVWKQGK